MSDPDVWPSYNLGSKDHLHAIGVLVAAWNQVEITYSALIQLLLPNQIPAAVQLFELLGNGSRWAFINDECGRSLNQRDADEVRYFLKCAAICLENRNAVVHAQISPQQDPDLVMLTKSAKGGGVLKQYWMSIAALRTMADDTFATSSFGVLLWAVLTLRRNWSSLAPHLRASATEPEGWPKRPPQPRKWDLHSLPNPASAQPPQQSSVE